MDHNHFLDLGERDFDSYGDARPGALRSTVDRKMAKFPVDLEIHDRFSPAIWKDYEAVYENSWKPEEGSLSFLRAIAAQEGEAGHLRMGIARSDGLAIGRASCRERVCPYVRIWVVAGALQKKNKT